MKLLFCSILMALSIGGSFAQNYQPYEISLQYQPYDIEKEYKQTNNSYAKDIIYEFRQKYYAAAYWNWFKGEAFRYKVLAGQRKEVFVGWVSWSDGIQWRFFVTELQRCPPKNRYCFIKTPEAKKLILAFIEKREISVEDVFLHTYYAFETDQKTKNIPFPDMESIQEKQSHYAVYDGKKLYLFDMDGNNIPN